MPPQPAPPLRFDRSFERLYRRHVASVYRYALAMLRNPSDAEDVTQTTFLNAYRVYQRGERPWAARSWLIAIAHNACRQRFRELRRRADEVSLDESSAVSYAANEDLPRAEDIQRALANLAFNQRAALVMRELEGRAYAEIGEALGLTTSAVETLIFRARRALREQLEGSLTCAEAKRAILRQLDERLPRSEKGFLRAHLRECAECSSLARRERARRAAIPGLGAIPLPHSLASFFGGGGATGAGVAAKAAAVLAAGAVAGGAGYEALEHSPWRSAAEGVAAPAAQLVSPRSANAWRADAASPHRTASPPGSRLVAATPERVPTAARVVSPAPPRARPAAPKTAIETPERETAVESPASAPRQEGPPARAGSGPAVHSPKTANAHSPANGRTRGPQAGRSSWGRAQAPGQTTTKTKPKTKSKPQKENAGSGAGAPEDKPAEGRAHAAAAGEAAAAHDQTVPAGQAAASEGPALDALPGNEAQAAVDAVTGAAEAQPGDAMQKP